MFTASGSEERSKKWGAIFGIISGISAIGVFVSFLLLPSGSADQILAKFGTYQNQLLAAQIVVGLLAAVSIPFLVALRNALKSRDNTMSTAGAVLIVIGILMLAILINVQISEVSTLAGIYAAGGQSQAIAVVAATAALFGFGGAFNISTLFTDLGLILLGLVMVNSKTFPKWVGYVGILSGIVGLISLVPAVFLVLAAASFALTIVWIFAAAGTLWRSAMPSQA